MVLFRRRLIGQPCICSHSNPTRTKQRPGCPAGTFAAANEDVAVQAWAGTSQNDQLMCEVVGVGYLEIGSPTSSVPHPLTLMFFI
jgi:hypothetical protein